MNPFDRRELPIKRRTSSIGDMAELRSLSADELAAKKILSKDSEDKVTLAAFRDIRTQLLQQTNGENFVLSVCSMVKAAGVSFVAKNIAAVLSLDEHKTALLIDCNKDGGSSKDLLETQPDYGLADYLSSSKLSPDDIIYATGVPRLRIVPSGFSQELSAEQFASQRMQYFVRSCRERYLDRFIIMDLPPIGIAPEARILSDMSDFTVLVVPYGKFTQRQIVKAVDIIGEDKLAGLIFNN